MDAKIVGYDHHFAGEHKGKEALTKNLRDEIACIVDEDKVHYEVINVIGGGDSPWAAIEAKATGKSKTGIYRKPFRFFACYVFANDCANRMGGAL